MNITYIESFLIIIGEEMGKMYPDFIYKEQIDIHELLGTFKEIFQTLIEENYSPEEEKELKETINNELGVAKQKSLVAIKIPLLNIPDIREELSLSDYIIYLIILETNLQGKFFDEENKYLTLLTGIASSQVEKSIKKLTKKDFVHYLDKNNQSCYNERPITHNQLNEFYKKHPQEMNDYLKPRINDKRVLVVNPFVFEYLSSSPMKLTKEERLEARKQARKEKVLKEEKRRNLSYSLIELNNYKVKNISNDMIKESINEEFKKSNPSIVDKIEKVLSSREITIEELIEFIDSFK